MEATKEDLIKFSTKGYRTLCFAMRVISNEFYDEWIAEYNEARVDTIKAAGNSYSFEAKLNAN